SARVCAPVLQRRQPPPRPADAETGAAGRTPSAPASLGRSRGADFRTISAIDASDLDGAASWGGLLAGMSGVPAVATRARAGATLGDQAEISAGFRHQYYGIRPFVYDDRGSEAVESAARPRLVTSGLSDPL